MSKIVGIGSGKKTENPCPHCYKVPASEHPAFTCPDIHSVAFDDQVPGWFEITYRERKTLPDGDDLPAA